MIWNRAVLDDGGASPGAGDTALAAALAFHGLAMSGGVLDAFERTPGGATLAEALSGGFDWSQSQLCSRGCGGRGTAF